MPQSTGNVYKSFPVTVAVTILLGIFIYITYFGIFLRQQNAIPSYLLDLEIVNINNQILSSPKNIKTLETNIDLYKRIVDSIPSFDAKIATADFREYNKMLCLMLLRALTIKEWPLYMICYWVSFQIIGMIIRMKREVDSIAKSGNELNIGYGIGNILIFIPIIYMVLPLPPNDARESILMIVSILFLAASRILITQNKSVKGMG